MSSENSPLKERKVNSIMVKRKVKRMKLPWIIKKFLINIPQTKLMACHSRIGLEQTQTIMEELELVTF